MTPAAIPALAALGDSVIALGDALRDDDWNAPSACPGWSVHDVLVHLTCTLREIAEPATLPGPVPGSVERSNDAAVNAYRHHTPQDTLADYRRLLQPALNGLQNMQTGAAAQEIVDFDDAGTYPAHLIADSLVFDHYCHLRHDLTGRGPLHFNVPTNQAILPSSITWMLAGLPQMSPPRLHEALTRPVGLELTGDHGGGVWTLHPVAGGVTVRPGRSSDTAATISTPVEDFILWSTNRISWHDAETSFTGDENLALQVVDAIHIF